MHQRLGMEDLLCQIIERKHMPSMHQSHTEIETFPRLSVPRNGNGKCVFRPRDGRWRNTF